MIPQQQGFDKGRHIDAFLLQIKNKSDRLVNHFLLIYFFGGIALAPFFGTWLVALGVGSLSLMAYYSAKTLLPESNLYQYVLSGVIGIFMAQYIYEMHGLFEMHFLAFIGSALLITYQNWKLQIPIAIVITLHHAVFGYLQYLGFTHIYFTRLEFMDLQTFTIHILLSATIFFICGLWAYQFKHYSERHIEQTFEMGRLQEEEVQKESLVKSNMELDKFVYSVSHDLRAPLTSMLGIIEISEGDAKDESAKMHLAMLKKSINKMDGFILDILDYSRNARAEIKKDDINFSELLEDISTNLKYMGGTSRKVDIRMNVKEGNVFKSDKSRISVVLSNLVSNAIRYQNPKAEKPYVEVAVTTSSEEALIVVKDNGLGISAENQSKIFDMFYRVSDKSVGSGLGLYIVKETVEKLNGSIKITSVLNKGTAFTIHIPNNLN